MRKVFSIVVLAVLVWPVALFIGAASTVSCDTTKINAPGVGFAEQCKNYCACKSLNTPNVPEVSKASCICNPLQASSVQDIIDAVQTWIFTIALVIAPLMIVLGAFYILTSAGEPSRVQKGRSIIIWAAIGLAVVLLAKVLYSVILGVIKG